MASTVHVDLIEGSTGIVGPFGWTEKAAIIRVLGLVRTLGADDLASLALAAADGAGYTYGSTHPTYSPLRLLGDRNVKVISPTAAEIAVIYRRATSQYDPNYVRIRGRVTLVTEKANTDAAGADLYTEWKPSAARPARRQLGTVDKGIPCVTISFSVRTTSNPYAQAKAMVGVRNADTFQGDAAGYWLVTGYDFSSEDEGDHWDKTIEVTRNPRLWKQAIYYMTEAGQVPKNWDAEYNLGKTVKLITVYGSANYSTMGLPNIS